MAPKKAPRTAYNLYISFYTKMHKSQSLQIEFECSYGNRELYKNFARTVLNDVPEARERPRDGATKYSGNDNFTDMSKNMSKAWNKVDKLTRTVFEDLAAEESKQHSEVCKILFFSLKDKSATCLLIILI